MNHKNISCQPRLLHQTIKMIQNIPEEESENSAMSLSEVALAIGNTNLYIELSHQILHLIF